MLPAGVEQRLGHVRSGARGMSSTEETFVHQQRENGEILLRYHLSLPMKCVLAGMLVSILVISYSYNYALRVDPSVHSLWSYLSGRQYRLLMFSVSLLPIPLGYFFGRARQRLLALRELCRETLVETAKGRGGVQMQIADIPGDVLSALTSRETEILQFICQGLANKEIAALLFISEKTVKNHINNIYRKLRVNNRTSAVLVALNDGLARR